MTEPRAAGLRLTHEHGRSLRISWRGKELLRYVYEPWDPQLESPRPYFHPMYTLTGDLVTLYRPHDHVWHKGLAWSLPNVGPAKPASARSSQTQEYRMVGSASSANFWGGVTYLRDGGYQQLANNGSMRHKAFDRLDATDSTVRIGQTLDWVTEPGEHWFTERRQFAVGVDVAGSAWTLAYATALTNVSGRRIVIGSPTTEGRPNAGYGGLFWRGPRSFSGGRVYAPATVGGDELMGIRAPWLGFCGNHDETGRASTLVFVDAPDNPGHPTKWFVRTGIYACLCPAPFFDEEVPIEPGGVLAMRYAVVVADGDPETGGAELLAKSGLAALSQVPVE